MSRSNSMTAVVALCVLGHSIAFQIVSVSAADSYASHAPTRPLPIPSMRPLPAAAPEGTLYFVDPQQGNDTHPGTKSQPWRTIGHGVRGLRPGDTLVLRGGTYFERPSVTLHGTAARPITLRSHPGEIAVIDGGLPEFQTAPATAWEPCPTGVAGEFWSSRTFANLGEREDGVNLLGHFLDSMTPLHGYRFLTDLRSDNPYWNISSKTENEGAVYCGPGVWYDKQTGRIHIRLAHTKLPGLGGDNYTGETDPRRLPLSIGSFVHPVTVLLKECDYVRLQDLVLRGSRDTPLDLIDCRGIELDGVTAFGGNSPMRVRDTIGLRMRHCACRGLAAPWTFRGSLKYRSIESRLFTSARWSPSGADCRDFEIAHCEFTDSVDGVFIGTVSKVRFHHNLLDNVSDDGIFLTAATGYDGTTPGGDVHISQNRLARCLTTFAFGVGHGRQKVTARGMQTGSGAYIFRNVFDFRRPVMYHWPSGPQSEEITFTGRVAGDHGSPCWEPMWIYHNTLLTGDPPRYDYGAAGLAAGMGKGTTRRVFNNIIWQRNGLPGLTLPEGKVDFQGDGNLFFSHSEGEAAGKEFFTKFRKSAIFTRSQEAYAPGWTARDAFADPAFTRLAPDWREVADLRLTARSPAVDTGVAVPETWPDPLRSLDAKAPDRGALPLGTTAWPVGVRGRLTVCGDEVPVDKRLSTADATDAAWVLGPLAKASIPARPARQFRAAMIEGYPAFVSPLMEFGLRRAGAIVDHFERKWVETSEFSKYDCVVIDGSFSRAKIEPAKFRPEDLPAIESFLRSGGTLILMLDRADLFASEHGKAFLSNHLGTPTRTKNPDLKVLAPNHAWIKHLPKGEFPAWITPKTGIAIMADRGERVLGAPTGETLLGRFPVGKGQIIYVGWNVATSLPAGRGKPTVEDEVVYEAQAQVLWNILNEVAGRSR